MYRPEYEKYLMSSDWQEKRAERFEKDGNRCVCCGAEKALQAHHITYERVGHEDIDDLVTLCADCHKTVHRIAAAYQVEAADIESRFLLDIEDLTRQRTLAFRREMGETIGRAVYDIIGRRSGKDCNIAKMCSFMEDMLRSKHSYSFHFGSGADETHSTVYGFAQKRLKELRRRP